MPLCHHKNKKSVDAPKGLQDARPEIDRHILRQILFDAVPQDAITWGHALVSAQSLEDGRHEIIFANGLTTVVDILIGAEVVNSRIRLLVLLSAMV